jgi:hypothetical protein
MPENHAEPPEERLDAALRGQRPAPSRPFAGGLRDRLVELEARAHRPPRLWALIAAYLFSGVLLLVLAVIGALGGGPFGS